MIGLCTTELVEVQCWCGMWHGVPKTLRDFQKRKHDNGEEQCGIFCPLGHSWIHSGPGRAKELEKSLAAERARHDQTKAARDAAEALRIAAEEVAAKANDKVGKLKKRAAAGSCPCCQRNFGNLQRHMKTKHPDFVGTP